MPRFTTHIIMRKADDIMPVMDEFREEREALKHGTFKEKMQYFWDYYKWHVIVTVAVIAFGASLIYQIVTRKDTALYAAVINGIELDANGEYAQGFAEYAGIDQENYEVILDASMRIDLDALDQTTIASSQKLVAYIAGKDIDIFITDSQIMEQYANSDTFHDLREFLSEEQYAEYEPCFYYIDQAVVDEKDAAQQNLDSSYVAVYPDPRNPDAMQDPIPVGIYLDQSCPLREHYYFADDDIIIGVVGNTERAEAASGFLDYLLQ